MEAYALSRYKNTQITTADQGKLVLMMYDGAMKFIEIAMIKLRENDIGGKGVYISKAQAIISELTASLNTEKGGEIAASLEKLYAFVCRQLRTANINKDIKPLEISKELLGTLREGWQGILNTATAPVRQRTLSL
jgi:flagellar protein FliS